MKSIKEKSEELSTAFRIEQGDVGYSEQLSYKLGVEEGANYVLECFESVLPFIVKKGIMYGKIKDTIEQLKGNQ